MDYSAIIKALRTQMDQIDRAIAQLESLSSPESAEPSKGRRGRKSMGAEERKQVAERMRRYWAKKPRERR